MARSVAALSAALAIVLLCCRPPAAAGADPWEALTSAGEDARARGDAGKAEQMFRAALNVSRSLAEGDDRRAISIRNLAAVLFAQRRYPEAETLYREAL